MAGFWDSFTNGLFGSVGGENIANSLTSAQGIAGIVNGVAGYFTGLNESKAAEDNRKREDAYNAALLELEKAKLAASERIAGMNAGASVRAAGIAANASRENTKQEALLSAMQDARKGRSDALDLLGTNLLKAYTSNGGR